MTPPRSQAQRGRATSVLERSAARARPASDDRLDYYHFGTALADLAGFAGACAGQKTIGRRAVRAYVENPAFPLSRRGALQDVLARMASAPGRRLSLARVVDTVDQGERWRQRFQSLGCRGFSFRLRSDANFHSCGVLSSENTLRFALLTDPELYYPPKVRQAMQCLPRSKQHVLGAIGWLLGQECAFDGENGWCVTNLQADLICHSQSCLRDHFRGWQRVLFWLVLALARRRGIDWIALPPAVALADSFGTGPAGGRHLDAWRPLYDGSASFFGLELCRGLPPVNIQPMQFLLPQPCTTFYVGAVRKLWEHHGTRPESSEYQPN